MLRSRSWRDIEDLMEGFLAKLLAQVLIVVAEMAIMRLVQRWRPAVRFA